MKNVITFDNATDILARIICFVIRKQLWIDRHILKAYFGIETPLYKKWWKNRVKKTQIRLNIEYGMQGIWLN